MLPIRAAIIIAITSQLVSLAPSVLLPEKNHFAVASHQLLFCVQLLYCVHFDGS